MINDETLMSIPAAKELNLGGDLSSLTKDQTRVPCSGRAVNQ